MKEAYAVANRVRESFNNYQNGAVSNQLMALVPCRRWCIAGDSVDV